ncbi:MAG: EAL domain-containing protein [Pseudomonadota bacterium]
MLLIASQSLKTSPVVVDLVREMSFAASFFSTPTTLSRLLGGESRRLVLVADADLTDATISVLKKARGQTPIGILVAADRARIANGKRADLLDEIQSIDNLEWVGRKPDFDGLRNSATRCRRRLLKVSREDINRAFEEFEFVVRYQPKVERGENDDWETREAEALVRWKHPELGLLGPMEFLPEIEAFGLMGRLTEFVMRKAAAQLKAWHEQGIELTACVNLASSLLNEPGLAARYAKIVRELKFTPDCFTLELIEQDLSNPEAPHVKTINELRAEGFRLCLDDFRVAAASLTTFERLPFDEIKIHAAALKRAQSDRTAMAVLAAVTGLAHNLGMTVCAEGVESQDVFEFLKTIECDRMQGFLISEAVMPQIIRSVYSNKDLSVGDVA